MQNQSDFHRAVPSKLHAEKLAETLEKAGIQSDPYETSDIAEVPDVECEPDAIAFQAFQICNPNSLEGVWASLKAQRNSLGPARLEYYRKCSEYCQRALHSQSFPYELRDALKFSQAHFARLAGEA